VPSGAAGYAATRRTAGDCENSTSDDYLFRNPKAQGTGVRRSSRFWVRAQAARHSTLLMCVPASQKLMQACTVSPPPPGALGADWLGLIPEVVEEAAVDEDVVVALPPLESMI
jgi:hypothetical protein